MRFHSPATLRIRLFARLIPGVIRIGKRCRIDWTASFNFRRGTIVIGDGVTIHRGAIIDAQKGRIEIGNNVSINPYSILYGQGNITIGCDVRIAGHCTIVAADHNFDNADIPIRLQGSRLRPIMIGNDVWLGAGVKVLAGAVIADGCVIGANSVVKGMTEPNGIYAGTPIRKIGTRRHYGEKT